MCTMGNGLAKTETSQKLVMPRLSTTARLKQKWFRFKKWLRRRFGSKPKLAWESNCPECGAEVLWGVDTRVADNRVIAVSGFRCMKCGWRPPAA